MYMYIYKFILRTEFNHLYERSLSKEFYNLSTNLALVCNLEVEKKKKNRVEERVLHLDED